MIEPRPDPDVLLKRVQDEDARRARGKLKIFFGATAGVGKTYAMLQAAHEQKREGTDVLAGVVVTHGRAETEELLRGLETLPTRGAEHRGVRLEEFDLDGALARRPALILVDELAHTNAPGSRHPKRWQDVEELLNAGMHVYTTVNVQHLESLNDVVAQITGVRVRETVPDSILEKADDVELIDLPPDDLLQRLKEGKVYVTEQAEHAVRHFFRKGNLIALRELALRRTAERVDQQMEVYRRDHAVVRTWPAAETIMVCVNLKSRGPRLVRAARRMAAGLHAKWIAVYVQTSRHLGLPESERSGASETLRLAEQLGAETVTLTGDDVSGQLLSYARDRNATKIIAGKPVRSRWKAWVFGSVVEELVRTSGDIDIYVISGEEGEGRPRPARPERRRIEWASYAQAVAAVVVCTGLNWLMYPYFGVTNLIMVYLLGVAVVAARFGPGPSIVASILGVAAFDFFFIEPYLTFAVSDTQYILTFAIMSMIALLISGLTGRLHQQADASRQRERRSAMLYSMSRDLAARRKVADLVTAALQHLREVFASHVAMFLPDQTGRLILQRHEQVFFELDPKESGVAQWVFDHGRQAGLGTDTLPSSGALYWPLQGSQSPIGVLAIRPVQAGRRFDPEELHLLETFANQIASAIERARLAKESHLAQVQAETERTRNAILSTVSHDLRTPLAAITGAASTFLNSTAGNDASKRGLVKGIYDEANRLDRLVRNLLDMTRLEAGAVDLHTEWHPVDEVVGAALTRLGDRLQQHDLKTDVPQDLPLVPLDGVLIQQVLINLIENAVKFTRPGGRIALTATASER
jgi:two-component system sensor histidine kinase KdpD